MNRRQLIKLLKILLNEELPEATRLQTFGEGGILTSSEGLVLRLSGGKELQITVVQSQTGEGE